MEGWGGFIRVFNVGDVLYAERVAMGGVYHCLGDMSTPRPGVENYINLGVVEVIAAYGPVEGSK